MSDYMIDIKGKATQRAYHDLNDINIEEIENPKRTIMLHAMIQELMNTAQLNDHDKIVLLKQLTLGAIYNTVENTMKKLEKENKEKFQKEFT